jgi:hypothetical protein
MSGPMPTDSDRRLMASSDQEHPFPSAVLGACRGPRSVGLRWAGEVADLAPKRRSGRVSTVSGPGAINLHIHESAVCQAPDSQGSESGPRWYPNHTNVIRSGDGLSPVPPERRWSMPKQSPSQRTGNQAEAFVAKVVTDMGFIWRGPKHPDIGIDGEIEIVDRDGQVTGAVALVQVKGTLNRFPSETDDSFMMTFRREHIDYWMRCGRPVLIVCVSVSRQRAWWKRLDLWFSDARLRSKRSVQFDKEKDTFDEGTAPTVAAAATSVSQPLALLPSEETLVTNLLEVVSFAPTVYKAPCTCRDREDAWNRMHEKRSFDGGFHLTRGSVISLAPLTDGPLAVLADGPITETSTGEWAESEDDGTVWEFVSLLNFTLRSMHHPDLAFHRDKKIVYATATHDLSPRVIKGRSPRSRGRSFFAPHFARDDLNKVSYCKHYAADLRFRRWEGQWYLEINPTYHYTIDGKRDSLYDSDYLAGIKRLERNKAVVDLLKAWADFLKRNELPSLFDAADDRIVFGELVTVAVDSAIDEHVWIVDYKPEGEEPDAGLLEHDELGA